MIESFHFIRPAWLLLLPLLALLLWLLQRRRLGGGRWRELIDEQLLPHLLVESEGGRRGYLREILGFAALLAIVALAGPTWEKLPQPLYQQGGALVIALDLSRSMDAADIKPSRLARARHKIADILDLRKEGQTALVVYAADAFTVTPLTSDRETIKAMLPALESGLMPAQGTRADRALARALELFANSGVMRGDILLISDGLSAREQAAVIALLDGNPGQRLSVLAIGTVDGGPIPLNDGGFLQDRSGAIVIPGLQQQSLRAVANRGGGVYATISNDDIDINTLSYLLDSRIDESATSRSEAEAELWRELGPALLLLVLPLAALVFRRGVIWMLPLCVVLLPPDAQAQDWQSWWRNSDSRASQLFDQGRHAEAAELFDDPEWKASAKYKSGDYEAALSDWQQRDGSRAHYNRANALAKLARYQEALDAYDELLRRDPDHEDARYNRDTLAEWLQQQQQQSGDDNAQPSQSSQNRQQAQSDGARSQQSAGDEAPPDASQTPPQQQADVEPPPQASAEPQQTPPEPQQSAAEQASLDEKMSAQAVEQWLRKIPDDPGGLLRRKFLKQYRRRGGVDAEGKSW